MDLVDSAQMLRNKGKYVKSDPKFFIDKLKKMRLMKGQSLRAVSDLPKEFLKVFSKVHLERKRADFPSKIFLRLSLNP
jgi:hypothetical protein